MYEEISNLATSLVDGFNVCIFAYGQTGSGKTYTMEGPAHDRGVNARILENIFELIREREGQEEFTVQLSLFEIYNEQLVDLLNTESKLKVRQGDNGLFVQDAKTLTITTVAEAQEWIEEGQKNRTVAFTEMNSNSSRSHGIICVDVTSKEILPSNADPDAVGTVRASKLYLIDLAGNERVRESCVTGKALEEVKFINKSLTVLSRVIECIHQKRTFVPFRDSQLTFLLQPALTGHSKVCFTNHTPTHPRHASSCSWRAAKQMSISLRKHCNLVWG